MHGTTSITQPCTPAMAEDGAVASAASSSSTAAPHGAALATERTREQNGNGRSRRGRARGKGQTGASASSSEKGAAKSDNGGASEPVTAAKTTKDTADTANNTEHTHDSTRAPANGSSSRPKRDRRRGRGKAATSSEPHQHQEDEKGGASHKQSQALNPAAKSFAPAGKPGRRKNFASRLTNLDKPQDGKGMASGSSSATGQTATIEYTDLRSRLIGELSSGAYDCSICYAPVATRDAIWSCSQCYTVLHLECISKWAKSSVAKMEEQNAMQEDATIRARRGTWRCPGCQYARQDVPRVYKCWDGRMTEPKSIKGAPPHSCGKPCAQGKCVHGCAAGICHPGPCPPCPITITRSCFCGAHQVSLRCSQMAKSANSTSADTRAKAASGVSCGGVCGKSLKCGSHTCLKTCHDGDCGACEEDIAASCYCGRQEKQMRCGSGVAKVSHALREEGEKSWTGRWSCAELCKRSFDCGLHKCQRPCHTLGDVPVPCPMSPAFIQRCPCGAEPLNTERTQCTDAIETCEKSCSKPLSCGHSCQSTCHLGDCPPCSFEVTTPCRCGETRRHLPCHQRQREESEGGQEVLCNTICRSQRLCGKHECGRRCCPLYFQAKNKSKRKPTYEELREQDPAGLHICENRCGKLLRCGLHTCTENCHRGQCPPCLQASFEELICHCGRTVMEPPVPCGTVINCRFPCTRPPPTCGHPKQQHDCHGDDQQCPPCIFLVEKRCMCGKHMVPSVPCHRARVSCGHTCDTPLACGYHRCQSSCHEGQCGPCHQMCTKPRKCGHPCPEPCHAPAACPNKEPCTAWVTLLCACGNIQQRVRCGQSIHNPVGPNRTLQCNESCLVAQRNAKLADALGLGAAEQQARSLPREYPTAALTYFASNRQSAKDLESSYTDFIHSYRHAMLLTPTSTAQRNFMHDLASVFRLQTEDVDDEPRRSVAVRRTQFAQPPEPTLTEAYRQHQERVARSRPTALAPLRRSATPSSGQTSGTSTPLLSSTISAGVEDQMNALYLRGVFGVDETTLLNTLRSLPGTSSAPMHVRWLDDEDVVITVSNSSTAKLLAMKREVRNAGLLKNGFSRLAREVNVCLADEYGRVMRLETQRDVAQALSHTAPSQSTSAWGSSSNPATSRNALHTTSGAGWAAVAASNVSRVNGSNA